MLTRRQKRTKKRVLNIVLIIVFVLTAILLIKGAKLIPIIFQYFFHQEIQLKETKDKRVNILVLGVGGGNHEGPDLTDTIIFTSLDPADKKVTLVSIPRDLWIPELAAKINTVYTIGEEQNTGGLALSKQVVGNILNQQIDYAIKIDFSGFEKAVDMVGGLDIDVENTFDDYEYPITGKGDDPCGLDDEQIASLSAQIASNSATAVESFPCRYEHLHFNKGLTHMSGETALKYVRSRHALGKEGSDFARSKRQEKVIAAFKDKIFSVDTFLNPVKVVGLLDIFQDSVKMDMKDQELDDFVKLVKKLKGAKITSAIVDTGDGSQERYGLLMNPEISEIFRNQWVLIPRTGAGDYQEIQEYVKCVIDGRECLIGETGIITPTPTAGPTKAINR